MTLFYIFIYFVLIVTLLFLIINFAFAKHIPYLEKDSPFECGYHSFLGQSRNQFNISFFIVGLFFLVFDLEIVLIYPFSVSTYFNEWLGLIVFAIFFVFITAGFVFEIGKGALVIITKQAFAFIATILKGLKDIDIFSFSAHTKKSEIFGLEYIYRVTVLMFIPINEFIIIPTIDLISIFINENWYLIKPCTVITFLFVYFVRNFIYDPKKDYQYKKLILVFIYFVVFFYFLVVNLILAKVGFNWPLWISSIPLMMYVCLKYYITIKNCKSYYAFYKKLKTDKAPAWKVALLLMQFILFFSIKFALPFLGLDIKVPSFILHINEENEGSTREAVDNQALIDEARRARETLCRHPGRSFLNDKDEWSFIQDEARKAIDNGGMGTPENYKFHEYYKTFLTNMAKSNAKTTDDFSMWDDRTGNAEWEDKTLNCAWVSRESSNVILGAISKLDKLHSDHYHGNNTGTSITNAEYREKEKMHLKEIESAAATAKEGIVFKESTEDRPGKQPILFSTKTNRDIPGQRDTTTSLNQRRKEYQEFIRYQQNRRNRRNNRDDYSDSDRDDQ